MGGATSGRRAVEDRRNLLPDSDVLYQPLLDRSSRFEGLFVVGAKTTGIFCRPTWRARKPNQENVEFFATPRDALLNGYRPASSANRWSFRTKCPSGCSHSSMRSTRIRSADSPIGISGSADPSPSLANDWLSTSTEHERPSTYRKRRRGASSATPRWTGRGSATGALPAW